jgi:glucosamine--fructose-6-phosphate aminotransferase (isomerizing)
MCGIVGFIGKERAAPLLLDTLRLLDYRGYDSAGVATVWEGEVWHQKDVGKVEEVQARHGLDRLPGQVGIGHVRWATHGRVTQANAHPHFDCRREIALVHNGIIDNYQELRRELEGRHTFTSETDSEVLCHLIEEYLENGLPPEQAVREATRRVTGSYALAVVFSRYPDILVGARRNSPLVVGVGEGGSWLASDLVCLGGRARGFYLVEEDETVLLGNGAVHFYGPDGCGKEKEPLPLTKQWDTPNKNGYPFFTLKEIMEEPQALEMALAQDRGVLMDLALAILRARQVVIAACGTSRHAAIIGRYLFSKLAGKFCDVVMASEFQYFSDSIDRNTLVIAVSQSGETADVMEGVRQARARGAQVMSLVNVPASSLVRMSDQSMYLNCGPELGVAATKSFTNQLAIFYLLAHAMANGVQTAQDKLSLVAQEIRAMLTPGYLEKVMDLARATVDKRDFYFLGRGINFAVATEGALKLKELSYVHAEGMAAGELKHGTLALIEEGTPVIAIAPQDYTYHESLGNAMETRARGAFVIGVSDADNEIFSTWLPIPRVEDIFYPLVSVIPLQLFAYCAAVCRGLDPDRPRNLAKSVTVK